MGNNIGPNGFVIGSKVTLDTGPSGYSDILSTLIGGNAFSGSSVTGLSLPKSFTLATSGTNNDTTNFASVSGARQYGAGLKTGRFSVDSFLGAVQDGVYANFTVPSGSSPTVFQDYKLNFNSYRLSIRRDTADITPFQAYDNWRSYMPGLYNWTVVATAFVDVSTQLTPPLFEPNLSASNTPEGTLSMQVVGLPNGSSKTLSGAVRTVDVTTTVEQGSVLRVTYTFQGYDGLTTAKTSSPNAGLWLDDASSLTGQQGAGTSLLYSIVQDQFMTFYTTQANASGGGASSGIAYKSPVIWDSIDLAATPNSQIMCSVSGLLSQMPPITLNGHNFSGSGDTGSTENGIPFYPYIAYCTNAYSSTPTWVVWK